MVPAAVCAMKFDRKIYFDAVREAPFGGALTQEQVDGQNALLANWERHALTDDLRHFAYMLATTKHETASTMLPVEEYGKGAGMVYGNPDPETGQTYYGRGYVQLTWRENYARATAELGLADENDLEWHAPRALDPGIAAKIMGRGMTEGWFRTGDDGEPETLERYFNDDVDDPYGARDIINGDAAVVPDWSGGVPIGNLIVGYHEDFLAALQAAVEVKPLPPPSESVVTITIDAPPGVVVRVEQIEH